jgi:hypothetical protein
MASKKHKFNEKVETQVISLVINKEYTHAKTNKQQENIDFETFISMLNASERRDKNYEWQSDINIPEFIIITLTQSANDVSQYFKTREFVEVYIEDESEETLKAADAQKECINRTLNQKHLYYYLKFVRAKMLNNLQGKVYLRCWWEQETKEEQVGIKKRLEPLDIDRYGRPMTDWSAQIPATRTVEEPIMAERIIVDRFNFDVYDPRNVFTDNVYTYSIQDKQWVIFRDEPTVEELLADKEREGYFNLGLLEPETLPETEATETAQETYNKDDEWSITNLPKNTRLTRLRRYGKFWCIVKERDETEYPIKIEPGIDENGEVKKDAVLLETIMTIISYGNNNLIIGFHATPYLDANDNPYRPIIRGLCYIHPTNDAGFGDAIISKDLQIAINDTANCSFDRSMLATIPYFMGRNYDIEDLTELNIRPGGFDKFNNPREDILPLKIEDNTQGMNAQTQFYMSEMQKALATAPPGMGMLPGMASTTATAIAETSTKSDVRSNYKAFSFEYTVLNELYWMISQMTFRFAREQTGFKLMGKKVYDFNPTLDYTYKPLSQSIENEYSKANKLKTLTTMLGYVAQIQHPNAVQLVNKILADIYRLLGDEYSQYAQALLAPEIPIQQGPNQQVPGQTGTPTSNQSGVPQSSMEQQLGRQYGTAGA